ncbi:hypothetical protein [Blastococcus sp. SYSU DS1024]
MDDAQPDLPAAEREHRARERLLDAGAAELPRPPWLRGSQPPHEVDLVRHLLWRSANGPVPAEDVLAGLALLPAVRAGVDQLETALVFAARAEGLSWAQIAGASGLSSRQAAQQRFDRVSGRLGDDGS